MGLSRLENFLKNARGNILYVSPNDLDSTDSVENRGNSLTRPFKTIQRALIEASRFSYQRGLNNDRFGQTTILLYPGDHVIDNRPGYIPDGVNNYRLRDGSVTDDLPPWDLESVYDLNNPDNVLFKMNSVHGGVIVPRGTSIVGLDLRKTKIRPKYVPNPSNDNIERSALFRITGACYFWQFTIFDADPNGTCYKDYTDNTFVPNFSHHKLTCFEYADGLNNVSIKDEFQTYSTNRTDLDMYYEKVGLVYGTASGREIEPDYPSSALDIQPKIDEYRIVGSTGETVGITSIKSGDGDTSTTDITVTTESAVAGLDVDTPFRVEGITADGYDGQFVVSERISSTEFKYEVQNAPANALPAITGSTVTLQSDTVTSASPYIFNTSLRSVFGMCGMHADGTKATGFKSMVVAQFTGISLQKDDSAFVKYNSTTGVYQDSTVSGNETLSTDSRSKYKPSFANFHIKCSNNGVIQAVSIFAIGYAEHFVVESGADMSITNSNSNFGANALVSRGFRPEAFTQDDQGYVTHIIPPKEVPITESAIEFNAIDVAKTVGVASTAHLYLYQQTNQDAPPENVLEGFRVGARSSDNLHVLVPSGGTSVEFKSRIVMPNSESSSEKKFLVSQSSAGINSISSNTITLTEPHTFETTESVRVFSDSGRLPDGLSPNTVYYVITDSNAASGITTNVDIQLAKTETDAKNSSAIPINDLGGTLSIVSRVSDKNSGDIGHPIQFDTNQGQWFVKVASASTENQIYQNVIVGLGVGVLGNSTPRTYIKRKSDTRNAVDTTYRLRYVIPSSIGGKVSRAPQDAFILQESGDTLGATQEEIQTYFGTGSISHVNQLRNSKFVADAKWFNDNTATIIAELPHDLTVGSMVEITNIKSATNTLGVGNSGFNGIFNVVGISSALAFTVGINTNPGEFQNDTLTRNTNLPYFKRKQYSTDFIVQGAQEIQPLIGGQQDGIYYFTVINGSNNPPISPFTDRSFAQPVLNLYPQRDKDTPLSDPLPTTSLAESEIIGSVIIDDVKKSITRETIDKFVKDTDVGVGITDIVTSIGRTDHTIHTEIDHGFNRIIRVSIASSGNDYGTGANATYFNAKLVSIGSSVTGKHATAKVDVADSGGITAVQIMDGGSAYGVGNTMHVVGIATTGNSHVPAVVTVTSIYDNRGDIVRISGVTSATNEPYNTVYRLTGLEVGAAKSFVINSDSLSGVQTAGIGSAPLTNATAYLTGEELKISTFTFDSTSGIATVTTSTNHGLKVNNKIKISTGISTFAVFNDDFVITENISLTKFSILVGSGATNSTGVTGSSMFALRGGIQSNDGIPTVENESLNGRMVPQYAGITTTLASGIANAVTDSVSLTGVANLGLKIGDYLAIDDEVVRIKTAPANPASNPIRVFRAVLGTRAVPHDNSAIVRRIKPFPVELRRHSINRASGHTFEYVGFGPGNYSTALPDRQDRSRTATEELLAQTIKESGGVNFFTGMNDKGISYSGNKKLSSVTGQEEIFDSPIRTVTGEDISAQKSINLVNATDAVITNSLRVDGGAEGKSTSEFTGPVIFTNKVSSTSARGIEATSIFIQGDSTVSRKQTVGIATPITAGTPGDIVYFENPDQGKYVGWVYTTANEWRRFGNVSLSKEQDIYLFDQVGIATTAVSNATFQVGSGSSIFAIDGDGVGIGTTANGKKLRVVGDAEVTGNVNVGVITASQFHGDGNNLTNLNASATGWEQVASGLGTGIYNSSLTNVGVGTTVPRFNLHLGHPGLGRTALFVEGNSIFHAGIAASDITVGVITANNFRLNNSSTGHINAGIVTTGTLVVGTSGTVITTTSDQKIGFGTVSPRAQVDIEGRLRLKSYHEAVQSVSSSSGNAVIDISLAQNFTITTTENITQFTLTNTPDEVTTFTIKIVQGSTGRNVGIDTFKNSGGTAIPVYWPGGVLPVVTVGAGKSDIYSFKSFDGCSTLYGVVGGQNFG